MKQLTEDEARAMLKKAIPWKGAHKVAEQVGVSKGHLSQMMSGKKTLNDKALAFIGCERIIVGPLKKERLQSSEKGA